MFSRILRKADGSPIFSSEADYQFHREMWNCLTKTMAVVGFMQEVHTFKCKFVV